MSMESSSLYTGGNGVPGRGRDRRSQNADVCTHGSVDAGRSSLRHTTARLHLGTRGRHANTARRSHGGQPGSRWRAEPQLDHIARRRVPGGRVFRLQSKASDGIAVAHVLHDHARRRGHDHRLSRSSPFGRPGPLQPLRRPEPGPRLICRGSRSQESFRFRP